MVKEKSEMHVCTLSIECKVSMDGELPSANSLIFGGITAGRSLEPVATIG